MRIRANGITIEARIDGPAGAPVVTFAHSILTDLSVWEDQASSLSRQFRVLRCDTRGHGSSEAPAKPYQLSDLSADVVGVWDALGIERSYFVGLSLGAMTGLGLALDHPTRLHAAMICATRADAPSDFKAPWPKRVRLASEDGMVALVRPTLDRWFPPETTASPQVVDRIGQMIAATSVEGFAGCVEALLALDFRDQLSRITIPVTYVVGTRDGALPVAMTDMRQLTPGSALEIIDNAGHITNCDQPAAFDRILRSFLADREG